MVTKTEAAKLIHANEAMRKGNFEPAIKLGIIEKSRKQVYVLHYLAEHWEHLFKKPLPLNYPVWVEQIPMIQRCIKKKDPTEMNNWLEKKEKERIANGEIW